MSASPWVNARFKHDYLNPACVPPDQVCEDFDLERKIDNYTLHSENHLQVHNAYQTLYAYRSWVRDYNDQKYEMWSQVDMYRRIMFMERELNSFLVTGDLEESRRLIKSDEKRELLAPFLEILQPGMWIYGNLVVRREGKRIDGACKRAWFEITGKSDNGYVFSVDIAGIDRDISFTTCSTADFRNISLADAGDKANYSSLVVWLDGEWLRGYSTRSVSAA